MIYYIVIENIELEIIVSNNIIGGYSMNKSIKALVIAGAFLFSSSVSFASEPEAFNANNIASEKEIVSTYSSKTYDSGVKNWLGGKWRHGVNTSHVWSRFYHASKYHNTRVKGAGGNIGRSGRTNPGETAYAKWEKAPFGNEAYANVE